MKIVILKSSHDKSKITFDFLYPVYKTQHRLRDEGFEIEIRDRIDKALLESDVLAVLSSCYRYHQEDPEYLEQLYGVIRKASTSYFFDISDAAGILYPDFFEGCSVYFKKQIYKNRALYAQDQTDCRRHIDYFQKKYKVKDCSLGFDRNKISNVDKMRVPWNVGVGDYRAAPRALRRLGNIIRGAQCNYFKRPFDVPFLSSRYCFSDYEKRKVDVMACFSDYKDVCRPLSFHRKESLEAILTKKEVLKIASGFYKKAQYLNMLTDTKAGVCPFGWGEISWKDFEMFIHGITVIKPDMSSIETWPDYYVSGETYVSYDWDSINLPEIVDELRVQSSKMEEIARKGQQNFRSYDVDLNPAPFVNRFKEVFETRGVEARA